MTPEDTLTYFKMEIEKAGGQVKWANKHSISYNYVNDIINGVAGIGPSVLNALNLKKVISYERK